MRRMNVVIAAVVVAGCWAICSRASGRVAAAAPAAAGIRPQLLNAAVFGRPTSEPIQPLREKAAGEAEPLTIRIDPRCGRYAAMDALYPPEVSEAAAKLAISRLYGAEGVTPSGTPSGMWRVEAQRLSIMVSVEREGSNKGDVHVWFTHFIGPDPCSDFAGEPLTK